MNTVCVVSPETPSRSFLRSALATAVVAALAPWAALAQSEEPRTKDLDAVVVTSTHRDKPLQKTPISVGVISAEQLDRTNMSNVSDLQYLVPGLSYSASATAANGGGFQIRGIGTQAYSIASEQTVGTVVDDVVISLPRDPGVAGFNDIDHVEVLRGPQGTLFGKNASAGVVNIATRDPEIGSIDSSLGLSLGERNEHVGRFTTNLGLSDTAALRLSGYYKEQDGAIPNVFHKWNAGDQTGNGIRAKFLWAPTDQFDVLLTAERQTLFTRDPYIVYSLGSQAAYNALFAAYGNVGGDDFKSYADADWSAWQGVTGFSGKLDYRFDGGATLTSITAYRGMNFHQDADLDQSPANFLDNSWSRMRTHQVSQEFRLAGAALGERLDYVLGAYYGNVDSTSEYMPYGGFNYAGTDPAYYLSLTGPKQHVHADTKSYALYANTTYALAGRWSASAGLRYTHDKVEGDMLPITVSSIDGKPVFAYGATIASAGEIEKGNVSGKVGLQFQQTPELMWYANVGTGYKGPTIDVTSTASNRIQPEKSTAYELGMKSQLLDRSLTFNASLFWDDFKDFQAQTFESATTSYRMANAGKMRTRGIELETSWRLTPDFTLNASGAITDAKFLDYIGACPSPGDVPCYVVNGTALADLSGFAPTFVSKYSYSLSGVYYRTLGNGLVFDANGGWSYKSAFYNAVAQSQTRTDGYGVFNTAIGIGSESGSWHVSLYARNLFDEHYRTYLIYGSLINGGGVMQHLPNEAFRTVGISLDLKF
ncbi:TonB-dependent receptor [Xanthomonas massiliensis]|uniref:TonB-dependent receptor n=1 Tax=Xanthomonas massiliensis TaxID=1720302 RepID=UPI00098F9163|nr:TonB-dependent receptor [Xanthomonas massiliensis]